MKHLDIQVLKDIEDKLDKTPEIDRDTIMSLKQLRQTLLNDGNEEKQDE